MTAVDDIPDRLRASLSDYRVAGRGFRAIYRTAVEEAIVGSDDPAAWREALRSRQVCEGFRRAYLNAMQTDGDAALSDLASSRGDLSGDHLRHAPTETHRTRNDHERRKSGQNNPRAMTPRNGPIHRIPTDKEEVPGSSPGSPILELRPARSRFPTR
jgi:hypothetical protein